MATHYQLSEGRKSTYAFLKNGGMKWASKVKDLSAEVLATAAMTAGKDSSREGIKQNNKVPQMVQMEIDVFADMRAGLTCVFGGRRSSSPLQI